MDLGDPVRDVLITAGATRNPIDAIRYLSAGSTGSTGVTLAQRLRGEGRTVHLLGSREACLLARTLGVEDSDEFGSTRDLEARVRAWVQAHPGGLVVHAAAVGDYEADPSGSKIPSGQAELLLRLRPAPKILDQIRGWGGPALRLVSFKAAAPETSAEQLVEIARKQAARTGSDLVFANVLGRLGADIALVDAASVRWLQTRQEALDTLVEDLLGLSKG